MPEYDLASLISATTNSVALIDPRSHRILSQSPGSEDQFGNSRNKPCYEVFAGRDSPCDFCRIHDAIANGREQQAEIESDDQRRLRIRFTPVRRADGVVDILETITDTTDDYQRRIDRDKLLSVLINREDEIHSLRQQIASASHEPREHISLPASRVLVSEPDTGDPQSTTNSKEWLEATLSASARLRSAPEQREHAQRLHHDPMGARLIELTGESAGQTHSVGEEEILGRDPTCSIVVREPENSRQHARIWRAGAEFMIEDLGSKNGTLVNGEPIEKTRLRFGDQIELGDRTTLLFTYLDQLQDKLLQSQKMEAIGRVASSVVHDFGNLLTSVLGNVALLKEFAGSGDTSSDRVEQQLDAVQQAAVRGHSLIKQLLRFVRSGDTEPTLVDAADTVHEIHGMLESVLPSTIELHSDPEVNLFVTADPSQLHQVAMNLCFNARDAMPNGGTLTMWTSARDESDPILNTIPTLPSGDYVELGVRDTGTGMTPDTQRRMFEPFFTTRDDEQGTGLGLSTVYGIVRALGGGVQVESKLGKGTTFRVLLPRTTP